MATLSTLDFLYITLSIGTTILVIVLAVLGINLALVIRDIRKVSEVAGDITSKFHEMILTPVSFIAKISESVAPQLEESIKNYLKKKTSKK